MNPASANNVLSITTNDDDDKRKALNYAAKAIVALLDEKNDINAEIKRHIEEAEIHTEFSKSSIRKAIASYYKYLKDTAKYRDDAQSFGAIFDILMKTP